VRGRTASDTAYERARKAMFEEGISSARMYVDPARPSVEDVIDEIVARTGTRDDGMILGFRAFFGRLAYATQALSFWLVHRLTRFSEDPRSADAQFGIRVHTAIVPAILLAIGVIVFLAMNTLGAEKADKHREELAARGL
jgi:Na+/melibiose symporter-like transporter